MSRPGISAPRSIARRARKAIVAIASTAVAATFTPATSPAGAAVDPHPVTPVAQVDLSRYLGTWRQIAAKPQWFEAACLRDVYANYALNADGTVRVTNTCAGPYGASIKSVGRARLIDKVTNAQLQVSFVGTGNYWYYPDRTPNYVIIGLGADYDWAVVGDPARQSAFILSRAAALTADQKATVISVLTANGFNACSLAVTPQKGGATKAQSLCAAS